MRRKAPDPSLSDLARHVARELSRRGQRLATAESCTGGWIAKVLTDIPGSSAWFDRAVITYSNAAKQELLGVPSVVLEERGAVSAECAKAMAAGLLAHAPVDWVIAVTGVAGPSGGTAAKPVGLVWIALAGRRRLQTQEFRFQGTRRGVRLASVRAALETLLSALDG